MHQVKQNITRADKPDVIKTTLLLFNHITKSIQQTIWKIEKKMENSNPNSTIKVKCKKKKLFSFCKNL